MKLLSMLCIIFCMHAYAIKPVPNVNIKKFSGLWYEIARTYNSFQHSCVASSVEYILQKDEEYSIKNRCFKEKIGAQLIEYSGTGKSAYNNDNMARINMTYFWIFTKEYKVVYLTEDYSAAIVVDEELDSIWIMYRKPKISKVQLNKMVEFLSAYIDITRLIYTPQDPQGRYK